MLRVLGDITAGFPSPAEEQELDTVRLEEWIVTRPEATFIVRVRGDSMRDAGILEGDHVLVERTSAISPGDIVVACIDGEWTLKYLRERNGSRYLESAHEDYPDMHPQESLEVEAKVVALVRRYHR